MKAKKLLILVAFWTVSLCASAQCAVVGDTLYYTIDGDCAASVADAITAIKGNSTYYGNNRLKMEAVILLPAGDEYPVSISNFGTGDGNYHLTIRSLSPLNRAVVSSLSIATARDIRIFGCDMHLSGGTGVDISSARRIVLEGNKIQVDLPTATPISDRAVLLYNSRDIQLLRNTIRAPHATLVGMQSMNGVLIMNNVLWSDNTNTSAACPTAFIRIERSDENIQNIGVYYNTLFLAAGTNTAQPVDFFALGNYANADISGNLNQFKTGSMAFQYNNCYSYSTTVPGRSANAFVVRNRNNNGTTDMLTDAFCNNIRNNNFWSKYDVAQSNTVSAFAPGCAGDLFVSAAANVCAADPVSPEALVVTGDGLNVGYSVTNDMSGLSLASGKSDDVETRAAVRPRGAAIADPSVLTPDFTSIVLLASSVGATVNHEIDFTGLQLTPGTTVTASLTGDDAADFALSGTTSFTADASGDIGTSATVVTFTAPAGEGEFNAAVRYTFSVDDAAMTFDVPLLGVHYASMGSGWTLGAFQQRSVSEPLDQLVWRGVVSSDWDERGNWINAASGQQLTCADDLSTDLTVTIPADADRYPTIPGFGARSVAAAEQINASGSKFASVIDVEYGAALHGVENLSGHYDYAVSHLTVGRGGWVLVGPVIKPFESGTSGEVRSAMSSDFYLNNLPHVYMHEALIEEGTASWGQPFSSMYETVDPTRAFAIRVPNEYGAKRLPDWYYYRYTDNQPAKLNDGSVDKTFTFTGKFCNDAALPTYSGLTAGTPVMLCNTYPANIDPTQLPSGTVQIYNYGTKSFGTPGVGDEILSQHGFVYTPAGTSLTVPASAFTSSGTSYRRAPAADQAFFVQASNEAAGVSSRAGFRLADKEEDAVDWNVDAPKVFNSMEETLPDLYVVRYGKAWQRVDVPFETESIPLGIRMGKASNIRLEAANTDADMLVTLEDRLTGETYDLSAGEVCEVSDLEAGTSEGRFYLQLAPAAPTSVIEAAAGEDSETSIDIFQNGRMLTISASHGLSLQWLELYDMSGRMVRTELGGGQLQRVAVSVAPGIYVARVVAGSEEKKVKLFIK